jgi:ATP-dependent Zn protease
MGQAKRNRYATAMHEASHVVVGLDCGLRPSWCSIVPDASRGYGLALGSTGWTGTGNVYETVKMLLAGKAAEKRMYASSSAGTGESTQHDLTIIYVMAWWVTVCSEKFTPHARLIGLLTDFYHQHPHKVPPRVKRRAEEMIADLLPDVRDILERRWHDVELIAGLLLTHRRITPEMIDEVTEAAKVA